MSDQLLSILVPVYNEQAYLARIIDRVVQAPVPSEIRKEIILVNDASTDQTAEVIERIVEKYPTLVRAFHQPYNQGKGAAIRRAIKEMNGDFAIIQDADLEYDPNEYPIVLKPLVDGLADVVYGSRFLTREMRKVLFYHHKLGNLFLTHLSNWTTGLDLTDMETCYKAFRGEILKSIPIRSNRFGIEPEITAKIAKRGLTVYEVPISYHGRRYSEGKKIGWKDGVSAIKTILTYWLIDDCHVDSADNPNLLRTMEQSRNFTRLIIRKCSSWFGHKIVELGAGLGHVSKYLPQKEILLLADPSENNIRILKNSYEGNAIVEVIHLDPQTEFPKEDRKEKYDTIVLFNQLEHAPNDTDPLHSAADLLEKNGRVLIVVPKESRCCCKLRKYGGYERRYSKDDLQKILKETGFEMESCQSFNRLGTLLWRWNQLRCRPSSHPFGRFGLKIFDTFLGWGEILLIFIPGANWFVVGKKK